MRPARFIPKYNSTRFISELHECSLFSIPGERRLDRLAVQFENYNSIRFISELHECSLFSIPGERRLDRLAVQFEKFNSIRFISELHECWLFSILGERRLDRLADIRIIRKLKSVPGSFQNRMGAWSISLRFSRNCVDRNIFLDNSSGNFSVSPCGTLQKVRVIIVCWLKYLQYATGSVALAVFLATVSAYMPISHVN